MEEIHQLLAMTIQRQASDLHIVPEHYPVIRINNTIYPLLNTRILMPEDTQRLLLSILNEEQKENLLANKEIDIGYKYNDNRFRVNIYFAQNSIAAAFRLIPQTIKTIEALGLPPIFHEFAKFNEGLVLITGPTGEGKSTSLASIINEINFNVAKHIVTIEDPIEFVYPKAKSIISQRELHQDTHSWNIALKSVLREDPDVVLVGEMRDYDTIQAVLTIAETGHLVFSTLHTITTAESINRIIDIFPSHQQNQIRNQLSSVLRAVVSQRLLPTIDNNARIPAVEVLMNIPSVTSVIREGKIFMLDNVLETEERQNMVIFEKYLARLYKAGRISKDTALTYAIRHNEITKFLV